MAALLTKHFIVDFPLQGPRHYKVKGTYGAWGGIEHALNHGGFTLLILWPFIGFFWTALWLSLAETVAHYHIDWVKMNLNARWNLKPDNSERFWWLLGFDQWLHHVTYVLIALWVVS